MIEGRPSVTALRAATYRAQHQLLDRPLVFEDPLAVRIIAPCGPMQTPRMAAVRAFICVRSRFAEDALAVAIAQGCKQYVVLGAGLDTFAYRNSDESLRVFEVDHPATQTWKRGLLAEAGISIPQGVAHVPVDFATQVLAPQLREAGFDTTKPAFFSWLGVTPYLDEGAILETLAVVRQLHPGNGIVFDYMLPRANLSLRGSVAHWAISRYVASLGEPMKSGFSPEVMRGHLVKIGFSAVHEIDCPGLNARYFKGRGDGLRVAGRLAQLVSASG
ncbi:MAG: class I SAM-dependent methyltransferase [Acidobacteriota bacterium]